MNRSPTDLLIQQAQPSEQAEFVHRDGKSLTIRRFRRDRFVPASPPFPATHARVPEATSASEGTEAAAYKLQVKRQLSDAFDKVYGRRLPNSQLGSPPTTADGLRDGAADVEAGDAYADPPTKEALAAALPTAEEQYAGFPTAEEERAAAAAEAEAFMNGDGSQEELMTFVSNKVTLVRTHFTHIQTKSIVTHENEPTSVHHNVRQAAALEALMHVFVQCDGRNWVRAWLMPSSIQYLLSVTWLHL